jgi:ribonuclease HI
LAPGDITDLVVNIKEPHAKGWIASVLNALPHEDSTRVVVTLWALWHAKRKAVHEGIFQSPLSTHSFIDRFLTDIDLAKLGQVPCASPQTTTGQKWIAPPAGLFKINVDAATSKNSAISSIAAVVRREDGEFVGASSVVLKGITDPETLEAMACREGFAVAADLLVQRFRLASDCSNVVRNIQGEGMGIYGHIVKEIKARADGFQQVQIVFEGRGANIDAHNLARSSIFLDLGRHVWFQNPPDGVCLNYNT